MAPFGGDDGGDSADGRAHGEQRGEFGREAEGAAEPGHKNQRERDFDDHQHQADAAEFGDVTEQKARAEQDDSGFQPEFVGGDAGLENSRDADGVGDDQADDDGPQYIFDIRQRQVMRFAVVERSSAR